MRMALAQFTPMAGDVDGNLSQMQALLGTGALQHADLVCFPELCLPGYLLEPAAYTAGFLADLARAAETLEQPARERQLRIVYGTAEASAGALRNVVVITDPGRARSPGRVHSTTGSVGCRFLREIRSKTSLSMSESKMR